MTDLLARLERAPEGSEALDKDIARHLGFRIAASTGGPHIMRQNDDVASWDLPKYSRSLDAALTLVPEGWAGSVDIPGVNNGAWLDPPGRETISDGRVYAIGATPALALCIAALKAREAAG